MNLNLHFDKHRYQRYFVDLRTLYQKREIVVYTGLILSLFAIAFFALFALKPTFVTIAALYKEIQVKKELNEKLQNKINTLRQAQINYAQVANSIHIVNDALPPNPALSEIIYPLEGLAQRANLNLTTISFSPVNLEGKNPQEKTLPKTSLGNAQEVKFDLSLRGDYKNIKLFLDSLEKLRRIIIIDSFILNKTKIEETSTMTLNLSGRAFYLPKEVKEKP